MSAADTLGGQFDDYSSGSRNACECGCMTYRGLDKPYLQKQINGVEAEMERINSGPYHPDNNKRAAVLNVQHGQMSHAMKQSKLSW